MAKAILRRSLCRTAAQDIFGHDRSAEFIAAASSPLSLPQLAGLPEVVIATRIQPPSTAAHSLLGLPKVVVTGRANAGKSTLLNAVLGRKNLLHTSKKPGRTQTFNFFRVGREPGMLVVVDAPGYGSRGRPEWGQLFSHYVENRKALRRVFVLINAKHGVTDTDSAMLRSLNAQCFASSGLNFTLQAIITKADALLPHQESVGGGDAIPAMQRKIFDAAPACLPAIITSALMKPPFGIEDVRRSIADACGWAKITDENQLATIDHCTGSQNSTPEQHD